MTTNRIISIRASSLGELFDCPARWEAKHILKRRMPSSGNAALGKAVHASTALYDQSRIDGSGLTPDDCEGTVADAIRKPDEEVAWDEDYTPDGAEKIGRALHRRYCAEVSPAEEYAAVEVRCESLELTDLGIALTGTTDRVRRVDDGFGIADLKVGKTAVGADGTVKVAGHAMQQGVYELMAERASGLPITAPARIIGLQAGKTERGQRIGYGTIYGARELLLGTEDSPGALEHAARLVHSGAFFGNPKSMMCHERYCPVHSTCKFRR